MDASLRLRSVQHDRRCHSERSEESSVDASLRLRSVQHDKVVSFQVLFFVIPSALFCHSERSEESSMDASLRYASFSMTDDVIPNAVRNPVWMLRYAQHDKSESNHGECSFLSFRAKRGIQCGSAKEFNRAGMANLTLLSLSFKRRGTFRHRRNRVR